MRRSGVRTSLAPLSITSAPVVQAQIQQQLGLVNRDYMILRKSEDKAEGEAVLRTMVQLEVSVWSNGRSRERGQLQQYSKSPNHKHKEERQFTRKEVFRTRWLSPRRRWLEKEPGEIREFRFTLLDELPCS